MDVDEGQTDPMDPSLEGSSSGPATNTSQALAFIKDVPGDSSSRQLVFILQAEDGTPVIVTDPSDLPQRSVVSYTTAHGGPPDPRDGPPGPSVTLQSLLQEATIVSHEEGATTAGMESPLEGDTALGDDEDETSRSDLRGEVEFVWREELKEAAEQAVEDGVACILDRGTTELDPGMEGSSPESPCPIFQSVKASVPRALLKSRSDELVLETAAKALRVHLEVDPDDEELVYAVADLSLLLALHERLVTELQLAGVGCCYPPATHLPERREQGVQCGLLLPPTSRSGRRLKRKADDSYVQDFTEMEVYGDEGDGDEEEEKFRVKDAASRLADTKVGNADSAEVSESRAESKRSRLRPRKNRRPVRTRGASPRRGRRRGAAAQDPETNPDPVRSDGDVTIPPPGRLIPKEELEDTSGAENAGAVITSRPLGEDLMTSLGAAAGIGAAPDDAGGLDVSLPVVREVNVEIVNLDHAEHLDVKHVQLSLGGMAEASMQLTDVDPVQDTMDRHHGGLENGKIQTVKRKRGVLASALGRKRNKKDYESLAPFKYFCSLCSFKTKRESHYNRHLGLHMYKKLPIFRCGKCNYATLRQSHLRKHAVLHAAEVMQCTGPGCAYRTDSAKLMKTHVRLKHAVAMATNNIGDALPAAGGYGPTEGAGTDSRDDDGVLYSCEFCDYVTDKFKRFLRHKACHKHVPGNVSSGSASGQVMTYQCSLCPYSSKRKEHFMRHMENVHSDRRPYLCDTCGAGFKRVDTLKAHRLVHVEKTERNYPYPCQLCDRRFRSRAHLRDHLTMHSNKREYLCEQCGESFKTRGVQRKHMQTIHRNPGAHECDQCKRRFNTKYTLLRHLKTHHAHGLLVMLQGQGLGEGEGEGEGDEGVGVDGEVEEQEHAQAALLADNPEQQQLQQLQLQFHHHHAHHDPDQQQQPQQLEVGEQDADLDMAETAARAVTAVEFAAAAAAAAAASSSSSSHQVAPLVTAHSGIGEAVSVQLTPSLQFRTILFPPRGQALPTVAGGQVIAELQSLPLHAQIADAAPQGELDESTLVAVPVEEVTSDPGQTSYGNQLHAAGERFVIVQAGGAGLQCMFEEATQLS